MWRYIVRSAIGVAHQQLGLPCQDNAGCFVKGNCLIGVVADGAGSAKFAEIGSQSLVKTTLKFINEHDLHFSNKLTMWQLLNTDVTQLPKVWKAKTPTDEYVKTFFRDLTDECIKNLRQEAQKNHCDLCDLASTLLVFIAHKKWLVAMQIGDSILVVRERGNQDYKLLFNPQRGEFANETVFITSPEAIIDMQIVVMPISCDFICAASDGLESVALRFSDWMPFSPFFSPLEQYLRETVDPDLNDQYIVDFLNSDRLNARTDDDKTLLIAISYE